MTKENKMGAMPVNKLLISMSLPIMISMIVQALYNVVDSVFVANYDLKALTAVSLTFPFQNLMIAFATGTGVGVNALLSRSLGEKNIKGVNKAASNGIFMFVVTALVFMAAGIGLSRVFFEIQGASGQVIEYGSQYMGICGGLCFSLFGQIIFERLLQSTGKTVCSMITQGLGAITNIILDPIMIFGMFGIPELGAAGAAIATVCGQTVAMITGLILNVKLNKEISISFKGFRPDFNTIKRIYVVGIPSILVASIGSVMTFGMNKIFATFRDVGEDAVNVFGVYFKLQSFAFMPLFGLNNGLVPIVAYNLGAAKKERIIKSIKLSVIYAEIIMLAAMLAMQFFPESLLGIFEPSANMIKIGIPALRIISISYLAAAFCVVTISVFQAAGHAFLGMIVSLVRQLCVLLPVAYTIAKISGSVMGVWYAFPIAEIFSFFLCVVFLKYVYNKEFKNL